VRVVSPYRDAVAWISLSGRLAITTYLLRAVDGWREVLPPENLPVAEAPVWTLVQRDPVEIVLQTIAGISLDARITVTSERCEIRIEPAIDGDEVDRLIVRTGTSIVQQSDDATTILIPAT